MGRVAAARAPRSAASNRRFASSLGYVSFSFIGAVYHMASKPVDNRNYKGPVGDIGQCIYCGARGIGVKLTKEHVIPFSLGSDCYLKNAACVPCARVTRDFEIHLSRNIYGHLRIHQGVSTSNPEERPMELPLTVSVDGESSTVVLPVNEHPFFLILPVWRLPGFFRNEAPHNGAFSGLNYCNFYSVPDNIRETLNIRRSFFQIGPDNRRIDAEQFARAIAKIAYCTAIQAYGIGSFKPLAIRDLILGKYSAISYFVGSSLDLPPIRDDADIPHRVNLEVGLWHNRIPVIIAHVRLFANCGTLEYGMPIYRVLIGIPSLELRNRLTSASSSNNNDSTARM
jgi:hypothetical protein